MPDTTHDSDPGADGPQAGGVVRAGDPADVEGGGRALDFADAAAVICQSLGDDVDGAWTPDVFGRGRDAEIACLAQLAIFDAGTTNLLEFAGQMFPIDILPVRPGGFLLERILEALQVPFWAR